MNLEFIDVTFRYPGTTEPSLTEVSATLGDKGEITLVTGGLGAGCSTLLLLGGALAPHVTGGTLEGRVRTLGADPTTRAGRDALAGRVGTLFPSPGTQLSGMSFTVWEELAFGPANLGWSRERIDEAVERVVTMFDLADFVRRDPHTLSGGELQRVIFGAVAATEPELFLLDEPVEELDAQHAERVYGEILPALARHAGIVIASADVDRAVEAVDRVVVMDRGRVVDDGDPEDVLGRADIVERGHGTTVAAIALGAGFSAPYPVTVPALVERLGS